MLLADVEVPSQSLKLNLVPRTQILGLFGPPKKRVIFGTFNKRQICVFCVFTPNYLSNKLLMLYSCVLLLLFTIACIPTLFWYIYLKKGQRVSQRIDKRKSQPAFWSPQLSLVPRTCAPCALTLRTGSGPTQLHCCCSRAWFWDRTLDFGDKCWNSEHTVLKKPIQRDSKKPFSIL